MSSRIADGKSILIAIPAGGCSSGSQVTGNNTAPSTGVPVLIGNDLVGIPADTFAAGTSGNVVAHLEGVYGNQKLHTGDTPAIGDKLYFDDTNKELTTTSAGNVFAGWAYSAPVVGTTDTTIAIMLKK